MSLRSHLHLRHSSSGRDAALDRLRWVNRSILAGSIALTAIFADTAASTFAGGTPHAKAGARHGKAAARSKPTHTATSNAPLTPPAESPSQAPEREPEPEATPTQEAPASQEAAPQIEEREPETQVEEPVQSESAPAPEEPPVVSGGS